MESFVLIQPVLLLYHFYSQVYIHLVLITAHILPPKTVMRLRLVAGFALASCCAVSDAAG